MSQKVDYILSLLIPFPTQESSVYVNKNKFSLRCAHAWTHGKSDSDKLWTQIYPLALRLRSSFRRHYFNSFSAPISLHSAWFGRRECDFSIFGIFSYAKSYSNLLILRVPSQSMGFSRWFGFLFFGIWPKKEIFCRNHCRNHSASNDESPLYLMLFALNKSIIKHI